jgi:hypothetical protein
MIAGAREQTVNPGDATAVAMEQAQRHVPTEESAMKFLFDDEAFFFETLRTAGFAVYGGAEGGRVERIESKVMVERYDVTCNSGDTFVAGWLFLPDRRRRQRRGRAEP